MDITGFSAEEHVSPNYWWTGDREQDPWEWREIIATSHEVAYGKFFGGKAGFISKAWLPYFANYRRNGYDFDSRYEDSLATYREKVIMDYYIGEDSKCDMVWKQDEILSTELKKMAGFGKGGAPIPDLIDKKEYDKIERKRRVRNERTKTRSATTL